MPQRRVVPSPLAGQRRPRPEYRRLYKLKDWRDASAAFLAGNPWCVECASEGRSEPATQTDHIVPHRGDLSLFWDRANWQPLCQSHHSRKTARGE